MGTLPPWNLKVNALAAAAAAAAATSNDSTSSCLRGDKFRMPTMIQLAAFCTAFPHRHIFLGRPEAPDLNFNSASVTRVEGSGITKGSRRRKYAIAMKRPYVLAFKRRLAVGGGLSNRSPAQGCHFCSESFLIAPRLKAFFTHL